MAAFYIYVAPISSVIMVDALLYFTTGQVADVQLQADPLKNRMRRVSAIHDSYILKFLIGSSIGDTIENKSTIVSPKKITNKVWTPIH